MCSFLAKKVPTLMPWCWNRVGGTMGAKHETFRNIFLQHQILSQKDLRPVIPSESQNKDLRPPPNLKKQGLKSCLNCKN